MLKNAINTSISTVKTLGYLKPLSGNVTSESGMSAALTLEAKTPRKSLLPPPHSDKIMTVMVDSEVTPQSPQDLGSQVALKKSHQCQSTRSPRRSSGKRDTRPTRGTSGFSVEKFQRAAQKRLDSYASDLFITFDSKTEKKPAESFPERDIEKYFGTDTAAFVKKYATQLERIHRTTEDFKEGTSAYSIANDLKQHKAVARGLLQRVPANPADAVDHLKVAQSLLDVVAAAHQELDRRGAMVGKMAASGLDGLRNEVRRAIEQLEPAMQ